MSAGSLVEWRLAKAKVAGSKPVFRSNLHEARLDKRPGLRFCGVVATPELEKIVERLNDLQGRGVIGLHAIGGAFAFIFYAEPIETLDLDIFTDLSMGAGGLISLDRLYSELRSLGYEAVGDAILIEGFPVQILPEPTPLVHEAVAEARTVQVGKQTTRVFTPEHAIAVALQTNRAKDRLKIEHLLESGREPLDEKRLEVILLNHGLEERWKKFLAGRG